MGEPYGLPQAAATVLAQICCWQNQLPQGAPSSPIVSNMVCARLDSELRRLAADHRCTVSRYADDITLSSNVAVFPQALASRILAPEGFLTSAGAALVHVIESNGFKVNTEKVRLLGRNQRQDVTGVVVNRKYNVPRRVLDQVRSMLHAWERFGYAAATEEWLRLYDFKKRGTRNPKPSFARALGGRLAHIRMIKGAEDPTFRRLMDRYRIVAGIPTTVDAIWVLEGPESAGSGFMLLGYGLVTCYHVIEGGNVIAFRPADPERRFRVVPRHASPSIDLAVCDLEGGPVGYVLSLRTTSVAIGEELRILGYPDWNAGNSIFVSTGQVISRRRYFGAPYFLVDATIRRGNSGGPALDSAGLVVGVVRSGARWVGDTEDVEHGVLEATALSTLLTLGPDGVPLV
jgi:RNA-directed DNA polymerase